MKTKPQEYRTKADQCDEQARKTRDPKKREWQTILARVFRNLAQAEDDVASRRLSVAASVTPSGKETAGRFSIAT